MPTTPPPAPPAFQEGVSIPERFSSGQIFEHLAFSAMDVSERVAGVGSSLLLYAAAGALIMVGFKAMLAAHTGQHDNPLAALIRWVLYVGIAIALLRNHVDIMHIALDSTTYIGAKLGLDHNKNVTEIIKMAMKPFIDLMKQREDIGNLSAWDDTELFFKAHLALFAMRALAFLLIFLFIAVGILVVVLSMLPQIIFALSIAIGPILIPFLVLQPHIPQLGGLFWNWVSLVITACIWTLLNIAWLAIAQSSISSLGQNGRLIYITSGTKDLVVNWELLVISLIILKLTLAAQFMLPFIAMQLGGARMGGKTR